MLKESEDADSYKDYIHFLPLLYCKTKIFTDIFSIPWLILNHRRGKGKKLIPVWLHPFSLLHNFSTSPTLAKPVCRLVFRIGSKFSNSRKVASYALTVMHPSSFSCSFHIALYQSCFAFAPVAKPFINHLCLTQTSFLPASDRKHNVKCYLRSLVVSSFLALNSHILTSYPPTVSALLLRRSPVSCVQLPSLLFCLSFLFFTSLQGFSSSLLCQRLHP